MSYDDQPQLRIIDPVGQSIITIPLRSFLIFDDNCTEHMFDLFPLPEKPWLENPN